jgi:hypothetical protein
MKHEIHPNYSGWLLHLTIVRPDGTLVHQTCYQMSSSIEMLKLYDREIESQKKELTDRFPLHRHISLMQVLGFPSSNTFCISTFSTREELAFYAKKESELIASNS